VPPETVMPWLMQTFFSLGGSFTKRVISSLDELSNEPVVVHCSGLGARELADDNAVVPVRGQIVIVSPPITFSSSDILISELIPGNLAYVVPRADGVLLGGTEQQGDWDDSSNGTDVAGVLERAIGLEPSLSGSVVLRTYAGLRPYRTSGIRLEKDSSSTSNHTLIHNYGHGGSGWTVSWGCASAVLAILAG